MFFKKIDKNLIDSLAIESLYEALYTYKPALVSGSDVLGINGNGLEMRGEGLRANSEGMEIHRKCIEFLRGSFADYFSLGGEYSCVESGLCFDTLRLKGKALENKMLDVSGGRRTHIGALFSLALMSCAAGKLDALGIKFEPEYLMTTIADFTRYYSYKSFVNLSAKTSELTNGEKLFQEHNLLSIRGSAEEGFRSILVPALDFINNNKNDFKCNYINSRGAGMAAESSVKVSKSHTSLSLLLMSIIDDSSVILENGMEQMNNVKERAKKLHDSYDANELKRFEEYLRHNNIEPKATSGMLALSLFIHKLLNIA